MKAMKHRRGLSAVLAGLFLVGCLPVNTLAVTTGETTTQEGAVSYAAPTITGEGLVTPECQVTVSSDAGGNDGQASARYAVDGITDQPQQWASDDMKDSSTGQQDEQEHQWLTVDLGESFTQAREVEAVQLWYNMKVWPMVYEIQTSSDNGAQDAWTTLARVERAPYDGAVKNGEGQNIADETGNTTPASAANMDTITADSNPALVDGAAVERYVRFYVEKVNTAAPGHNVCLREIQVYAKPAEEPEEPDGDPWNLALDCTATSSGDADGTQPANAVDGSTETQWNSLNLKNFKVEDNSKDQEAQDPHWIQIDLGETGSTLSSVGITYVNNKVWAMEYKVQTTDTPNDETSWVDVAYVSRPSANSTLVNGAGQNIANPDTYTDTITTTSKPALTRTELGRYVRVYLMKTNAQAPGGDNVNIREITIMGTNPNLYPAVDVNGEMNKVTVSDPATDDTSITLPTIPGGELVVRGSELENVVANNGAISQWNIGARDVTLLLRLTDRGDKTSYAQKNVTVTVPDHKDNYPAEWFPAVTDPNPKPEVIPTVQEWYGYEGSFTLTSDSKVILNDKANVGLRKVADNLVADVKEISGITLTVETGNGPTSPHDIYIESLTSDENSYDVGDEGYVMVTNDQGLHIYAPTYTGCLYGTITAEQILWQAEDHVSIPKGIMRDYPAYEVRGLMLDVARTPYRYQQLKDYAKIMLWYKMNEFHLHVNDNDNANISNSSFDTHSGFHRLESEEFPSLTSETKHAGVPEDLINSDYYNDNADYQGNPTYTKDQWRELTQMCEDMGMYVLTELDMPGHSLLYNKYAEENPDNISWLNGGIMLAPSTTTLGNQLELLDLTGPNSERALKFASTLWDEYTRGEDPVVNADVVHIGADEYWVHNTETNNAFAEFADTMRQTIQNNLGQDTKIRMWGASTGSFATAQTALNKTAEELAADYQLDIWSNSYDKASERVAEGYQVINCRDAFLYANPGRTNRDVPNAEYLFYDWNPTMFGGSNPMLGEPNLMGAKGVVWGDQSQEGMTELDIHQRVLRTISILSEKTWGGTDDEDTFTQYELRADRLAEGPGTQIAMDVDSVSSLVLDYDFHNVSDQGDKIYDASGNGYDAALTGGTVADGWLTFDGSTLLETPLKTLSYPYTVSFDLKLSAQDGESNTAESSLFSGYDGRIQVAGHNGNLSADVNYFTRDFGYQVPTDGTAVNVTIVGTFQATRLYVDGELVTFLSQKQDQDGVAPNAVSTLYSSVLLPLEKIGQDFHGQMANLKVYNKALSVQEVAGTDDGKVNVAQNAWVGGDSYESSDANGQDNGVQRTRIAMKAVDGETFTSDDDNSSEIYSYWQGDHGDSSLTVDLGQVYTISQVDLHWRADGIGRDIKIMTSLDSKTWTEAKVVSGNTAARQTVTLDTPVEARFVKMQGNQASGTYKLQEMLVYEQVDKTQLNTQLAEAEKLVAERGLTFEDQGSEQEQALFQAVVLARALKSSPLATASEVALSAAEVKNAVDNLPAEQPDPDEEVTVVTETDSQVTVSNAQDVFEGGTVVKVESISNGEIYDRVENALKDVVASMDDVAIFEFTATKDGVEVEPTGNVYVTLEIPENLTAHNLKMYYVAVNGTKEEVSITVDEETNTVTVTLPHFSTYVLVNERTAPVVDKAELEQAIAEADKLQKEDYTAESWEDFQKALADAKAVEEDSQASQQQVDDALAALKASMEALEDVVPTVPPTEGPTVPPTEEPTVPPTEAPTAQPTQQPDPDNSPAVSQPPATDGVPPTGDQNNMTLWISLLVVSAVVVVAIIIYQSKNAKKK